MDLLSKFLLRVDVDEIFHCWEWTGSKNHDGYGLFCVKDGDKPAKIVRAHRWSYEFFIGPIPEKHQLNHFKCRNKSCVNPWHVEPLTQQEHLNEPDSMISLKRNQSHCKRGHLLDGENLHIDANGSRQCRPCRRFRERRARLEGRRK